MTRIARLTVGVRGRARCSPFLTLVPALRPNIPLSRELKITSKHYQVDAVVEPSTTHVVLLSLVLTVDYRVICNIQGLTKKQPSRIFSPKSAIFDGFSKFIF